MRKNGLHLFRKNKFSDVCIQQSTGGAPFPWRLIRAKMPGSSSFDHVTPHLQSQPAAADPDPDLAPVKQWLQQQMQNVFHTRCKNNVHFCRFPDEI